MNSTCKLQLLSLVVLASFLSIGVSVLLLLTSGDWHRHDSRVYQQFIHTSLIIGGQDRQDRQVSPIVRHHPLTRRGQDKADGYYYNSKAKRDVQTVGGNTGLVSEVVSNSTPSHLLTPGQKHKRHSKRQYHKANRPPHSTDSNITVSNSTVAFHLVPGQQRDISPRDLCPHHSMCTHFLKSDERALFRACADKSGHAGSDLHCHCQFMNTTGHGRVALVSLPGSGNTWLRGLLERATGVCTGSLFCDKILHGGGMCGEGLRDGVLTVKTHDTQLQWTDMKYKDGKWSDSRPFFNAAIVLVRSPFKALVAEWNRQNAYKYSRDQQGSSHVKYLESSQYFCKCHCE